MYAILWETTYQIFSENVLKNILIKGAPIIEKWYIYIITNKGITIVPLMLLFLEIS